MPRFRSARHDAVALAAYLLWKNPRGHGVARPLSHAQCDGVVSAVARSDAEELERVLARLARHVAPEPSASEAHTHTHGCTRTRGHETEHAHVGVYAHTCIYTCTCTLIYLYACTCRCAWPCAQAQDGVSLLVATLEQWITLGDGCTVVSHGPPTLTGAASSDVSRVWGRVPTLVGYGLI